MHKGKDSDAEPLLRSLFDTVLTYDLAGNLIRMWGKPLALKNPFFEPSLREHLSKLRLCLLGEPFHAVVRLGDGVPSSLRGVPERLKDGSMSGFHLAFAEAPAEELNNAAEHLMLVRHMRQGLWRFDSSGTLVYVNSYMARLLGRDHAELMGKDVASFRSKIAAELSKSSKEESFEEDVTTSVGRTFRVQVISTPILDTDGRVAGRTELIMPLPEQPNAADDLLDEVERMTRLAFTDPLTGVANRHAFDETLHKLVEGDEPFALLLVDLDMFKQINDTHGHDCGDKALIDLSERLLAAIRETDLVGRLGGDEFGIILPNASQLMTYDIANRLKKSLNFEFLWEGSIVPVRVSIGAAHSEEGAESILAVADRAMYRQKNLRKKQRADSLQGS